MKFIQLVGSVLPGVTGISAVIAASFATTSTAGAADVLDPLPWAQTQAMLDRAGSVWTAPPKGVVSGTMTRGPLLGNGAVGVTAESDSKSLSLLISHTGFICDTARAGPSRIGGITIASATPDASGAFRLEQAITNAELRATLVGGWTARSFVAATDDLLITEVTNTTDRPLALLVSTLTPPTDRLFTAASGSRDDAAWATRETFAGKVAVEQPKGKPGVVGPARWVSRAALVTHVFGAESKISADPKTNTVTHTVPLPPGKSFRIACRIGMSRETAPLETTLAAASRETAQSLEQTSRKHTDWWKAYWNKSQVVLNDAVLERYYYTALYAMACANRAGREASGLYGSWITKDFLSWGSNIHLNYNGEAPYFGVYSANRPELAAPFNAAMLAMMPDGRRRAKEDAEYVHPSLKGRSFSGILYPVGVTAIGVASCDQYLNQVYDASYAAMQFIEQYEFTRDDEFLKKEALPFVGACGDFWESFLESKVVDGKKQYTFSGGTREWLWGPTPATDLGYIRRIFTFLIANGKTVGTAEDRLAKWRDILDHLPPFPTTTYKDKTVIAWDATGKFNPNENCFGIDCIYPGDAINLESEPALLELARETATAHRAWGQTNNMPRIFLSRLRVGAEPVATRKAFFSVVKGSMGPNAMLVDDFHGMEKCGGIEVVNRLLMNSDAGVIRLFPDWDPKQNAEFRSLRAKGAFLVSAALRDGTITEVRITSEKGRDSTVLNPWPGKKVRITRNGHAAETVEGERFTLKTSQNETLTLTAL